MFATDQQVVKGVGGKQFGTWGSGPLLCMARVLIPLWKLQMLILTIILLVKYYTLKQPTDNMSI